MLDHGAVFWASSSNVASLLRLIHRPSAILSLAVILRSRSLRARSSVVPCCLTLVIFYLTDIRGVCVIRDITAGDRWLLFRKCKTAERLVFNEFDFRCWDISFKWKGCS